MQAQKSSAKITSQIRFCSKAALDPLSCRNVNIATFKNVTETQTNDERQENLKKE